MTHPSPSHYTIFKPRGTRTIFHSTFARARASHDPAITKHDPLFLLQYDPRHFPPCDVAPPTLSDLKCLTVWCRITVSNCETVIKFQGKGSATRGRFEPLFILVRTRLVCCQTCPANEQADFRSLSYSHYLSIVIWSLVQAFYRSRITPCVGSFTFQLTKPPSSLGANIRKYDW